MNSIHEKAHADQHWAGNYFGDMGALAVARSRHFAVKKKLVTAAFSHTMEDDNLSNEHVSTTMERMSTVFSAIGHCLAQLAQQRRNNKFWYILTACKLAFELYRLVEEDIAGSEWFLKRLHAGQRDVLIASLLFLRWFCPGHGYGRQAAKLLRATIGDDNAPYISELFAKARASRLRMWFIWIERDSFHEEVSDAIYTYAPDSLPLVDGALQIPWHDVARLARLIGDKKRKRDAAAKSGAVDAKLKAVL
jgi:hypothetical protein